MAVLTVRSAVSTVRLAVLSVTSDVLHPDAGRADAGISRRIPLLDCARGFAILAMVSYHFSFDLMFFRVVSWPVMSGVWHDYAASIASSFVFIAGVSLVLAHRDRIHWRAFLRRLAVLLAAAAAVTAATLMFMPEGPIYFGILHAIALFSVLGLAFLRLPPMTTLLAAVLVAILPRLPGAIVFHGVGLVWTGLSRPIPPSMDYEPLFPWFSAMLLGIAAGRLAADRGWFGTGLLRRGDPGPWAPLAWAGRNSLAIYLLHQPILFGGMWGLYSLGLIGG